MSLNYNIHPRSAYESSYRSTSGDVKFSDYLINEPKLKPRLAAIFDVEEKTLQCTWIRGQYQVRADKELSPLNAVGTRKK